MNSVALLGGQLNSFLHEQFTNARFIKAIGQYERSIAQSQLLIMGLAEAKRAVTTKLGEARVLLEYIGFMAVLVTLALTQIFGVSPGAVMIVFMLFTRLFPRFSAMQAQYISLHNNLDAFDLVNGLQLEAQANAERK